MDFRNWIDFLLMIFVFFQGYFVDILRFLLVIIKFSMDIRKF